ncbi:CD225/dispanin family protein [Prevotella ihumii]|uniref:CD225/dispanin family protein n=1 Tax=Prevotella ihumii TaxID=1917878 RepID=UPI0009FD2085|nr:CD225/dispanin family protein [Prevotella ihumii]
MDETMQFNNPEVGNNSSTPMPPKPDNYLILAILTTACCCLPIGIYAIILANRVNTYYFAKQYDLAVLTAREAKKWSIIGIVAGIVFMSAYWGIYGVAVFSMLDIL